MNNLIFVAKKIGLECLKFHLELFSTDCNQIVVCEPESQLITSYLDSINQPFILLKDFSIQTYMLDDVKVDWLLNLWGGYIFKKNLLNVVKNSINIHPSYLPYGRGRDPVVWAIREQIPVGVSLHEINEKVDEGDIWYQEEIAYHFPITGSELYEQVVLACIRVFKEHWPKIRSMKYQKIPQNYQGQITKKREHLLQDRVINYDTLANSEKDLLLKILAHDFGEEYTAVLNCNSKHYMVNLKLKEIL